MDWYFISLAIFNMPSLRVSVGMDLASVTSHMIFHVGTNSDFGGA